MLIAAAVSFVVEVEVDTAGFAPGVAVPDLKDLLPGGAHYPAVIEGVSLVGIVPADGHFQAFLQQVRADTAGRARQ